MNLISIMLVMFIMEAGITSSTVQELVYRRAYADKHFSEGSSPGSQTDRGRVYVGLGAPDSLEIFDGPQYPYQRWIYRHIGGIGSNIELEFVDQYGKGVYRIVPWSPVGNDPASRKDRKQFEKMQERIRHAFRLLSNSAQ